FGRMLTTIRENAERAEFIGVNVRRYELVAFVLAGAFAGLAGGLLGIFNRGVFPDFAYWTKSSEVLIMTLLGGMSTFYGPGIGAVTGPNGAGKTTVFNLITGHLRPDRGRVTLNGRDVTGVAPHDLCRLGVGRSFQRTNIFPRLTVFENVQAAFVSHRGRGWN